MIAQCKASLALSMLLLVKEYLKTAYSINSERIEAFSKSEKWLREPCLAMLKCACSTGSLLSNWAVLALYACASYRCVIAWTMLLNCLIAPA